MDPGELAKKLTFNSEGKIIWSSLPDVVNFRLDKRLFKRDDAEIQKSLDAPDKAVMLEVNGCHWVVALRKLPFGLYWIADPWDATKCLSSKYKKITGSAHMVSLFP